jgi:hypothetical protein
MKCSVVGKGKCTKTHQQIFPVTEDRYREHNELFQAFFATTPYVPPGDCEFKDLGCKEVKNQYQLNDWWRNKFSQVQNNQASMYETDLMIWEDINQWEGLDIAPGDQRTK